ncbi:hypothetical protein L915_12742 [Phytophthora nicotianae]|uniref:Uncharacterized protein n=1 Tax=Phytophthora nicotianae TaxID=4792 RepID=W2GHK5_PHYNI|nr:hypothetical protein L915_12742 [Phytophthora nicotianae]
MAEDHLSLPDEHVMVLYEKRQHPLACVSGELVPMQFVQMVMEK